jgi:hypothetical protein
MRYVTTAYDQYGNSWNVTAAYNMGNIMLPGNTVSPNAVNTYTVTATFQGKTATATLSVVPGEINHFIVSAPSNATAGVPFELVVTAVDAANNPVADFTGSVSLNASRGTITPSITGDFSGGVWTGAITLSDSGAVVVTASDNAGHSGQSAPVNVVSSSLKPTPTPTPSSSSVEATTSSGATLNLTITGNITSTQISEVTISTNQTAATTTISFTVTGESGTSGFCNITLPKSQVQFGTTPVVYIDGQQIQSQGYSEDDENFYVWYTISFSTHQVKILFTETSSATSIVWYVLIIILVVAGVAVALALVAKRQKNKHSLFGQKLSPS